MVWSAEQDASYVFEVIRYLHRYCSSRRKQDEMTCLMQDYNLLMLVNLAMTHLDQYDDCVITSQDPELQYVIRMLPPLI